MNGATQIHADLRTADPHGQPLGIRAPLRRTLMARSGEWSSPAQRSVREDPLFQQCRSASRRSETAPDLQPASERLGAKAFDSAANAAIPDLHGHARRILTASLSRRPAAAARGADRHRIPSARQPSGLVRLAEAWRTSSALPDAPRQLQQHLPQQGPPSQPQVHDGQSQQQDSVVCSVIMASPCRRIAWSSRRSGVRAVAPPGVSLL
jgi:hypothetical protein